VRTNARAIRRSVAATSVAGMVLLGPLTSPLGSEGLEPIATTPSPAPDARAFELHIEREVERRPPKPARATGVRSKRGSFRVFAHPRGTARNRRMTAHNPIAQRLVLGVEGTAKAGRWMRVLLPERPNGSTGWVSGRAVRLVRLRERIVVDLSHRRLSHYRDDEMIHRFRVGIGMRSTPTPRGRFYVWARVEQPSPAGPYGVFALGLSAFSPVLTDWPGGGRSAVHGTADASDRGERVSHGCVRVYNRDMEKLVGVPMGTPVVITR
jgi:lipoprotein-anchoring transpeptidase ErfK/SrfK